MIVVSPMPNRIISTGTSAESGALTKMLTHMPSRFVRRLDPAHQHAERHADDDGEHHADAEAAQAWSSVAVRNFGVCTSSTSSRRAPR